MFYRLVDIETTNVLGSFPDDASVLAALTQLVDRNPAEVDRLALVRVGDDGLAVEAWSAADLRSERGDLRIPEFH